MRIRVRVGRPWMIGVVAAVIAVLAGVQPASAAGPSVSPVRSVVSVPLTDPPVVPACEGTTSTADGSDNTPTSFTLIGEAQTELLASRVVFQYGNEGTRVMDDATGALSSFAGGLPYCGGKLDGAGNVDLGWRFCTDFHAGGCAGRPPGEVEGNPKISEESAHQIAYVLSTADVSTKRSRALAQLQVWCLSEGHAADTVNTEARNYFNQYQFDGSDPANPETAVISDAEATCAQHPVIPATPTLAVTGPAQPSTTVAQTAQFTVAANFDWPITITSTGTGPVTLCPGAAAGVTLTDGILTAPQSSNVALCTTTDTAGAVTLTAAATGMPTAIDLSYVWNGDPTCQVFVDFLTPTGESLSASATTDFVAPADLFGGITIAKTDVSGAPLSGASFSIFLSQADATAGVNPVTLDGLSVFPVGADGTLTLSEIRRSDWANGAPVAPGDTGYQSYWLKEITAPTGYVLLASPIEFSVTEGTTTAGIDLAVANVRADVPTTGGGSGDGTVANTGNGTVANTGNGTLANTGGGDQSPALALSGLLLLVGAALMSARGAQRRSRSLT